ncbi:Kelch repeat-containing protein [Mucilaginibacter sp. FT3.2]|uniref:Kelch repeat-containing protein n=1 Tax=Mucilaginibacter sp. FT3.2 TaxID=2723090 RepID=UPI0016126F1B|nr:kelch repeat-containing protein [Mucilaginibacter sp. FT3.2]MBB6230704.1 N-acetylneuraminic acid mutarotase [Mucilaginibacter sp. FT3.2]
MKKRLTYAGAIILFMGTAFKIADSGDGSWQVLKTANKADARSECGFAAVNGKLYLIGGDGPAMPAEVLDPATLTWTKKAIAPVIMHHLEPVVYGNKIYVLDAFADRNYPNQIPLASVYSYDTQKDVWEKGGEIPADRRRGGAGEAEYKGKLYIVNGITHGHTSGTTNMFDEYDPVSQKWTKLPDAPHIRDHSTATVVNDRLYAVGGRNTSLHDAGNFMSFFDKTVLEVDCYNFKTGKWTTLDARLPLGTGGGALVNLNNKLYYMGGERATATTPNGPQKETYYLDLAKPEKWVQTESLNLSRNGTSATVLNGKIYLAGGSGGGPGGPPPNGNNPPPGPPQGGAQGGPHGEITVEVFSVK